MAGDYTRFTFHPQKDPAGVLMQQGRVLLGSDWNEQVELLDRRFRAETVDIIGRAVVPRETPNGFSIQITGTPPTRDLSIGLGRAYVHGLLAENHGAPPFDDYDPVLGEMRGTKPILYSAQPYFPKPPPLLQDSPFPHLVYLDVWEREVTWLQDPDLIDKAVGVDTATRLQTVWQVRVLANVLRGTTCSTPDNQIPGWPDIIAPSAGRLSTATSGVPSSTDPCLIPPNGGYRGTENRLYRVEIHAPGGLGTATFKWSRDNASVASPVTGMDPGLTTLSVVRIGRDAVLRFQPGDWVEVTDNILEFAGSAGEMRQVASVDEAKLTITLTKALTDPKFDATRPERCTRVIRWDQRGIVRDPLGNVLIDVDSNGGLIPVPATASVILEDGVQITFSTTPVNGSFRVGDHWCFAARTADASVELLQQAPPRGILHHYARLAVITFPNNVMDCRTFWPPDFSGGCCTVSVRPEDFTGHTTLQTILDQLIIPAMVVTAVDAGAAGNNIAVTIGNIVPNPDPTQTTFDITVTETNTYTGLTTDRIEEILGSDTVIPGREPGLVNVIHGTITGISPSRNSYPLLKGAPGTKANVTVMDNLAQAFELAAKKVGQDGNSTTVTISNTDPDIRIFNLEAVWTKSVPGVTISTLQQRVLDQLSYEIAVTPPSSGAFAVPAAGTTYLSGGTDGTSPSAASATFASQMSQITVCLRPGVYTLPRTLTLGPQHAGVTLEACHDGVILQAAAKAESQFLHGLIMVNSDNITLRGLVFKLPLVPFPADAPLAGLTASQLRDIGGPQINHLQVAIGLRALQCANLRVEACTFDFPLLPPREEGLFALFAAGILAGASCRGLTVSKNRFQHAGDAISVTETTFAVKIGCVLTPSSTIRSSHDEPTDRSLVVDQATVVASLLDHASFCDNMFVGLTAAALLYADSGTIRVDANAVQQSYGGFWLLSLRSLAFLPEIIKENALNEPNQNLLTGVSIDPIVLLGSVLARGYPLPSSVNAGHIQPQHVIVPPAQIPSNIQQSDLLRRFFVLHTLLCALEKAAFQGNQGVLSGGLLSLHASNNDMRGGIFQSATHAAAAENVLATMLPGGIPLARETPAATVNAITAPPTPSGTMLVVWGNAGLSQAVLSANALWNSTLSRLPWLRALPLAIPLATATVLFVPVCTVTGNVIFNADNRSSPGNSLFLFPSDLFPDIAGLQFGGAVTGNVFVSLPVLPARSGVPSPLDTWAVLNTILIPS